MDFDWWFAQQIFLSRPSEVDFKFSDVIPFSKSLSINFLPVIELRLIEVMFLEVQKVKETSAAGSKHKWLVIFDHVAFLAERLSEMPNWVVLLVDRHEKRRLLS